MWKEYYIKIKTETVLEIIIFQPKFIELEISPFSLLKSFLK